MSGQYERYTKKLIIEGILNNHLGDYRLELEDDIKMYLGELSKVSKRSYRKYRDAFKIKRKHLAREGDTDV